jgi:hypothetical protein
VREADRREGTHLEIIHAVDEVKLGVPWVVVPRVHVGDVLDASEHLRVAATCATRLAGLVPAPRRGIRARSSGTEGRRTGREEYTGTGWVAFRKPSSHD